MNPDSRIRALERQVADLSRRAPTSGLGNVTTTQQYGLNVDRPYQVGFPAKLTSTFATTTGYSWASRILKSSTTAPEITDPTIPLTGNNAHTPDNNTTLPVDTEGWMEPDPQGGGWLFIVSAWSDEPPPAGCTGAGPGWVAGLLETEALYMEVPYAAGLCSEISTSQTAYLRWDVGDSKWVSQVWDCDTDAWVDYLFVHDGGSGQVKFWVDDTTGSPLLMVDGVARRLTLQCGGNGVLVFAGGTDAYCTEGLTPIECGNYFQVRLTCICDPIDGWQGEGWYCVTDSGGDCETDDLEVVYLDDPCVTDILICSCKFDTELEALAACVPPTPSCCSDAIPDDIYLHLSATGGCADLDGLTIHLQRDVMVSTTVWPFLSATGGTGGCVSANITQAQFTCTTGALLLTFGADNSATTSTLTAFSCSPFGASYDLTFTFSLDETCCSGTATAILNSTP